MKARMPFFNKKWLKIVNGSVSIFRVVASSVFGHWRWQDFGNHWQSRVLSQAWDEKQVLQAYNLRKILYKTQKGCLKVESFELGMRQERFHKILAFKINLKGLKMRMLRPVGELWSKITKITFKTWTFTCLWLRNDSICLKHEY